MAHRLAPEAAADLDAIWFYVAKESGDVVRADRIVDAIAARFVTLAAYPQVGRQRDDLRPGLRSIVAEGYVVIYRIENADVLILHILHGSRDIDAIFSEPGEAP